jgi:hypothetical protein
MAWNRQHVLCELVCGLEQNRQFHRGNSESRKNEGNYMNKLQVNTREGYITSTSYGKPSVYIWRWSNDTFGLAFEKSTDEAMKKKYTQDQLKEEMQKQHYETDQLELFLGQIEATDWSDFESIRKYLGQERK